MKKIKEKKKEEEKKKKKKNEATYSTHSHVRTPQGSWPLKVSYPIPILKHKKNRIF